MMVADLVFYLFAAVTVAAALGVITSRNQVHSVLFLILAFFTTAGLFVLLKAEFLAALLVIVYMGAVAVLFLFVVMMLDVDFESLRAGVKEHLPMGLFVGAVILAEFAFILSGVHVDEAVQTNAANIPNTQLIGQVLYTKYLFPFEIASLVLLVALIGAVVLTLRKRKDAKRQHIPSQIARTRDEAVELVKVAPGQGA
ncbi:MAG: NADH-quinone oxidoreductase subunit J [Magnetococcales bacterium]|nr:NADH-quinone oxidoreductase subunit J [Magnetococcales bacterium]NGZ06001.1 NADH-quinone oxidoreductase subunit J [Magnetococcales bacterium]